MERHLEAVCRSSPFTAAQAQRMVAHMNADHADAMRDYCRLSGLDPGDIQSRMGEIDANGWDLMVDNRLLTIGFEALTTTPDALRETLVDLAQRARVDHPADSDPQLRGSQPKRPKKPDISRHLVTNFVQ